MAILPRLPNGAALKISTAEGVLGGTLWPSASLMCQYVMDRYFQPATQTDAKKKIDVSSWNVLELGSGTGAVGIFVAALGIFKGVHLSEHKPPMVAAIPSVPYNVDGTMDTDLFSIGSQEGMRRSDRLLKLLHHNVQENSHIWGEDTPPSWPPRVHELDWSIENHSENILRDTGLDGFDLILASDVTYISELHQSLADTAARLLANTNYQSSTPTCLMAHQQRVLNLQGEDFQLKKFQESLDSAGLCIVDVHQAAINANELKREDKDAKAVSILEIQHKSVADTRKEAELWIPSLKGHN